MNGYATKKPKTYGLGGNGAAGGGGGLNGGAAYGSYGHNGIGFGGGAGGTSAYGLAAGNGAAHGDAGQTVNYGIGGNDFGGGSMMGGIGAAGSNYSSSLGPDLSLHGANGMYGNAMFGGSNPGSFMDGGGINSMYSGSMGGGSMMGIGAASMSNVGFNDDIVVSKIFSSRRDLGDMASNSEFGRRHDSFWEYARPDGGSTSFRVPSAASLLDENNPEFSCEPSMSRVTDSVPPTKARKTETPAEPESTKEKTKEPEKVVSKPSEVPRTKPEPAKGGARDAPLSDAKPAAEPPKKQSVTQRPRDIEPFSFLPPDEVPGKTEKTEKPVTVPPVAAVTPQRGPEPAKLLPEEEEADIPLLVDDVRPAPPPPASLPSSQPQRQPSPQGQPTAVERPPEEKMPPGERTPALDHTPRPGPGVTSDEHALLSPRTPTTTPAEPSPRPPHARGPGERDERPVQPKVLAPRTREEDKPQKTPLLEDPITLHKPEDPTRVPGRAHDGGGEQPQPESDFEPGEKDYHEPQTEEREEEPEEGVEAGSDAHNEEEESELSPEEQEAPEDVVNHGELSSSVPPEEEPLEPTSGDAEEDEETEDDTAAPNNETSSKSVSPSNTAGARRPTSTERVGAQKLVQGKGTRGTPNSILGSESTDEVGVAAERADAEKMPEHRMSRGQISPALTSPPHPTGDLTCEADPVKHRPGSRRPVRPHSRALSIDEAPSPDTHEIKDELADNVPLPTVNLETTEKQRVNAIALKMDSRHQMKEARERCAELQAAEKAKHDAIVTTQQQRRMAPTNEKELARIKAVMEERARQVDKEERAPSGGKSRRSQGRRSGSGLRGPIPEQPPEEVAGEIVEEAPKTLSGRPDVEADEATVPARQHSRVRRTPTDHTSELRGPIPEQPPDEVHGEIDDTSEGIQSAGRRAPAPMTETNMRIRLAAPDYRSRPTLADNGTRPSRKDPAQPRTRNSWSGQSCLPALHDIPQRGRVASLPGSSSSTPQMRSNQPPLKPTAFVRYSRGSADFVNCPTKEYSSRQTQHEVAVAMQHRVPPPPPLSSEALLPVNSTHRPNLPPPSPARPTSTRPLAPIEPHPSPSSSPSAAGVHSQRSLFSPSIARGTRPLPPMGHVERTPSATALQQAIQQPTGDTPAGSQRSVQRPSGQTQQPQRLAKSPAPQDAGSVRTSMGTVTDSDGPLAHSARHEAVNPILTFALIERTGEKAKTLRYTDLEVEYAGKVCSVAEVRERGEGSFDYQSTVVRDVREAVCAGYNAAVLSNEAPNTASRLDSPVWPILNRIVRSVLEVNADEAGQRDPNFTLCCAMGYICDDKVKDLLAEDADSPFEKISVHPSPIYGPRVSQLRYGQVTSGNAFEEVLSACLTRAAENSVLSTMDRGVATAFLLLKQIREEKGVKDVYLSSILVSSAGSDVEPYASGLNKAKNDYGAVFHLVLGGPCLTCYMLNAADDDQRNITGGDASGTQQQLSKLMELLSVMSVSKNYRLRTGSVRRFIKYVEKANARARQKLAATQDHKVRRQLEKYVRDQERLLAGASCMLRSVGA